MKKEILVAIGIAGALCSGAPASLSAQEKLSLEQCREMALKYNKDMAAANKRTEAARLMRIGLTTLYRKIEEYGLGDK